MVSEALQTDVLTDLERDVNFVVKSFETGYEPRDDSSSLTSGTFVSVCFSNLFQL